MELGLEYYYRAWVGVEGIDHLGFVDCKSQEAAVAEGTKGRLWEGHQGLSGLTGTWRCRLGNSRGVAVITTGQGAQMERSSASARLSGPPLDLVFKISSGFQNFDWPISSGWLYYLLEL